MKKLTLIVFLAIVAVSVAMAQIPTQTGLTTDILGAHLLYGRGCVGCHAPHSGSGGNGVLKGDWYSGNIALWGQDLTPLYGQTMTFGNTGHGTYPVTLPGTIWNTTLPGGGEGTTDPVTSISDPSTIVLLCLSCHDGNLAVVGMMKGTTVETLPIVGGHAPTLLGADGTTAGNYLNDHPVGPTAYVSCGGQYNWDCSGGGTTGTALLMNGTASNNFTLNYGYAVSFATTTDAGTTYTSVVTCTTCHNQHSELIYNGAMQCNTTTATKTSPCATNYYQTAFFLRGYYNPLTHGNNAAQFCRQCHGGESNEMNGQMSVPTS